VQAILSTPNYIYAGGNFGIAGGITVNRIARWNRTTSQWEKLENVLSNSVNALTEKDGYIYVGGAFTSALNDASDDNIIVNSIVRWKEGSGWEAMGESTYVGVDNLVNALTFINCKLYVGGNFTIAGSNTVENLACWKTVCPITVEVMGADVTGISQADSLVFNPDDCVIQSQAEFVAGKLIELKVGFHAQENSVFTARIAPCGSSSSSTSLIETEDFVEEITPSPFSETGINEKEITNFKIFPNPTSDIANFQYELTTSTQIELSLYDLSGKLIKNILPAQIQETGTYSIEFSTERLSGVYWVEFQFGERKITKKLVVL